MLITDRVDYCYVVQKLVKICKEPKRKIVFEAAYGPKCADILNIHEKKGLCRDTVNPNVTISMSNANNISQFLLDYTKTNILVMKMFIKDPFYTKIGRGEGMSTLSFISTAAGLLGLCMGLSFVSMFEVVYRFFNFSFDKITRALC
jgi:hypothetical protein